MFTTEGLSHSDFAQLKSALDEAALIAITDKAGVITYVNKNFCEISKYTKDELLGKTHRIINSGYHPKDFYLDMWKTISSGEVWEGEIRNRAKDGSFYWVHTNIVPFLDESGKPEKYVAVRYDVTERKLVEEQLKDYAKKLEISNKELQDFASVAAHDLQEPLRKIGSFSDRLKKKTMGLLPEDSLDYVNRIQSSAGRMQVLINDLLTYSRVTTKAKPFSRVDLNEVLQTVKLDCVVPLEESNGTIEWDALPTIEADKTQMYQLFQNLVGNALKFSKPGISPHVIIGSKALDGSSRGIADVNSQITVQDNGIGFDEQYLNRIFTIFQRLHGKHEYKGSGIGLSVCRKIVDRHGGTISATSSPGEGAKFVITLPIRQNMEVRYGY